MFGQQLDELARDPQIHRWMDFLSGALVAVLLLIVMTDIVLLTRWLLYRIALKQAEAQFQRDTVQGAFAVVTSVPGQAPTGGTVQEAVRVTPLPMPYAPPRPPFAPQWSLVDVFVGGQAVVLLLIVLSAVVLFLAALPVVLRVGGDTNAVMRDPGVQFANVFIVLLQNVLLCGVVAFFVRRYGLTLASIGLRRHTRQEVLQGLALGLCLLLLATGVETGLSQLLQQALSPATAAKLAKFSSALGAEGIFAQIHAPALKFAFLLAGAVAAPIGEEMFFRGFLYNALKHRFNVTVGIVVSGLAFALVHVSPLALAVIFPMGMALAYVYEKTRSLWVVILMHAVNNGVALTLAWLYPQLGS